MNRKRKTTKAKKTSSKKSSSGIWGFIKTRWKNTNRWKRIPIYLFAAFSLFVAGNYAISYWYMKKHANEPLVMSTTFIASYAEWLGVDPQETMQALIDDVGFRHFRLVSYWDRIEKQQGTYDFGELDWQFEKAEASGSKISLAIGLRQPRWPECHMPEWAKDEPMEVWSPQLNEFIETVVNRYKGSPALESYQLENEFFMTVFGECPDFTRERLVSEFELVKRTDPHHPVIITRSNNWGGIPIGAPTPDQFGVSVYKRVWDKTLTKRYFEYPYPAWFYGALAGAGEIVTGKSMIVHELQMEPWSPEGLSLVTSPIEEQDKSMNAERLRDRFKYGRDTGIRFIGTWGSEWWYARKKVHGDPSLWNVAKEEIAQSKTL